MAGDVERASCSRCCQRGGRSFLLALVGGRGGIDEIVGIDLIEEGSELIDLGVDSNLGRYRWKYPGSSEHIVADQDRRVDPQGQRKSIGRAGVDVAVCRFGGRAMSGRIVVGVDGSGSSRTALRWAADEARCRRAEQQAKDGRGEPPPGPMTSVTRWPEPNITRTRCDRFASNVNCIRIETFGLDVADEALKRLQRGEISGAAVLQTHGLR